MTVANKSPNPERRPTEQSSKLDIIGWREWVQLPKLGVPRIKAKIDTGARSSSLHAFNVRLEYESPIRLVHFEILPFQECDTGSVQAVAELVEFRVVRSSSGHEERRPVIRTELKIGRLIWPIEVTLTNRDSMGFRMLIGRQAIRHRFMVDPARSFLQPRGR
jgi:hypothetical protein